MKEEVFIGKHEQQWMKLERLLNGDAKVQAEQVQLPELYRQLCSQMGVAKQRRYGTQLLDRLNLLATEAHHRLYSSTRVKRSQGLEFFLFGFPQSLRQNRNFVFASAMLFFGPLFLMGGLVYWDPELVYTLMSVDQVRNFESMYDPGLDKLGRERDAGTDLAMFGFYIKNNIGIGFQTFASGLLFGLGAIFYLVYNGLSIGAVAGYLTQKGYVETFYGFVSGHSAFELLAIVFCGAAGLKLGFALLVPAQWRRSESLKIAAMEAVRIVYGAAIMLLFAAGIEAFWSSSTLLLPWVKYSVGISLWVLLLCYFVFAGNRSENYGS